MLRIGVGGAGTTQGVLAPYPNITEMIDGHGLIQDGTKMEGQGLCVTPELELAYRQRE